ncbi:MAG TPA: L,D-transpeptidase family protein [Acidimicrobiales bacterium]|nr:L,D-transpeptidase family protein [Acidimicrobiales bacterium]
MAVVLALGLTACSSPGAGGGSTRTEAATATTAVSLPPVTEASTSTSTSTTEAPTTTTTAAAAQQSATVALPSVRALQERLAELGYDVGTPDGKWGARTTYSLMAFQKVEGLTRDGQDGPETQAALANASPPGPMVPGGAPTRIEIDVARQVLFHWVNGSLARILPVSTGNNERYCVGGDCSVAVTPGGSFRIGRKAAGLEVAPLGELWWPMYFNGGIAIHGSPSVPAYPASHGCIRIPMYAAPTFYDQVPAGTRVHVLNSPEAEAPPDEGRAVPDAVAPPDTTPTTTARPEEPTTTTTVEVPDTTTSPPTTSIVVPTVPSSTG